MNRRDVLKMALALGGLMALPVKAQPAASPGRVLVLVELVGGNDGLNTLVPYSDPEYYRLRPTLAIPRDRVVTLTETLGLHPALGGLRPAWDAGELALIQGLGYANPNRSHFRSIDIWNTGSDSDQVLNDGWLAPALKALRPAHETPIDAIVLDGRPQPVSAQGIRAIAMSDPESFVRKVSRARPGDVAAQNPAMRHLAETWAATEVAAEFLQRRLGALPELGEDEGGGVLLRQLRQVARLVEGGVSAPVYKVSFKGFDTHAEQAEEHAALLAELAGGFTWFRDRMKAAGRWQETLVVTYSEFGRRAAENGSLGTDHGAASMAFALGGAVKGGLFGTTPSLTDLLNGDPRFHLDYRSVYAAILQSWFHLDPALLPGGPKPAVELFA